MGQAYSPVIQELVDLLGEDDAKRIFAELKGQSVFVPAEIAGGHPLAETLGLDLATRLAKAVPGCRLEFPVSMIDRKKAMEARNRVICRQYENGTPVNDIAFLHEMTARNVRLIVKAARVVRKGEYGPSAPGATAGSRTDRNTPGPDSTGP